MWTADNDDEYAQEMLPDNRGSLNPYVHSIAPIGRQHRNMFGTFAAERGFRPYEYVHSPFGPIINSTYTRELQRDEGIAIASVLDNQNQNVYVNRDQETSDYLDMGFGGIIGVGFNPAHIRQRLLADFLPDVPRWQARILNYEAVIYNLARKWFVTQENERGNVGPDVARDLVVGPGDRVPLADIQHALSVFEGFATTDDQHLLTRAPFRMLLPTGNPSHPFTYHRIYRGSNRMPDNEMLHALRQETASISSAILSNVGGRRQRLRVNPLENHLSTIIGYMDATEHEAVPQEHASIQQRNGWRYDYGMSHIDWQRWGEDIKSVLLTPDHSVENLMSLWTRIEGANPTHASLNDFLVSAQLELGIHILYDPVQQLHLDKRADNHLAAQSWLFEDLYHTYNHSVQFLLTFFADDVDLLGRYWSSYGQYPSDMLKYVALHRNVRVDDVIEEGKFTVSNRYHTYRYNAPQYLRKSTSRMRTDAELEAEYQNANWLQATIHVLHRVNFDFAIIGNANPIVVQLHQLYRNQPIPIQVANIEDVVQGP